MIKTSLQITTAIVLLLALLSFSVCAQDYQVGPRAPQDTPQATTFSIQQLDKMLAPIALYPDQLLADILMAVTYPREVVAAYRWLQEPNDSALHGDQLAAALQDQTWDPSVKALVVFPDVVRMIDGNLQWAEQLGDAFMGQQGEVIDEIQHLRKMAIAANVLKSTQAQTVTTENGIVSIEPTNLNVVYVPILIPTIPLIISHQVMSSGGH